MPRVPTRIDELLSFCAEHSEVWSTAASIGVTPAQATAFKNAYLAASGAVSTQNSAKDAAKAATLTANARVRDLRQSAAGMIRSITTYASAQADPNAVYAAAQIDPPSPRSPSEPPGQPTNISATLDDEGNITLRWKCVNPQGGNTVYSINRRSVPATGAPGDFLQVGVSGARNFTDETIPAGSPGVQYVIRGFRGQTVGPASAIFTLQFGRSGGSGLSIASQFSEGAIKKAA